jgi:hypothetical protein
VSAPKWKVAKARGVDCLICGRLKPAKSGVTVLWRDGIVGFYCDPCIDRLHVARSTLPVAKKKASKQ